MDINKFLEESILENLYKKRKEEFSYDLIKKCKENKNIRENVENRLKQLLNFVEAVHYKYVENEIDEILWQMQGYAEHWNGSFYKVGVVDGMHLDNEIKEEMEKLCYGQTEKSNG